MITLGLDPGVTTGYGVVSVEPSKRPRVLDAGSTRLTGYDLGHALYALGMRHGVELVAVERIVGVSFAGRKSNVAALVDAADVAGLLRGYMLARGCNITTTTALEWRKALVGNAHASDAEVARTLGMRMTLPRTNAHARDAIGVAVFCGMRAGRKVA